ncbi:hypothetical protein GJU41_12665 [Bacillus idriensis]|uniref:Phage protein n=1 Tax=Metabacillus idriensis TaxID=324768 RepID=A0A6I2MBZ4_9BACI|nr:hypothetical protein [Metabacillus idriensis]MRX54827.1 hypothetical protein [Metabacillus idriensis]
MNDSFKEQLRRWKKDHQEVKQLRQVKKKQPAKKKEELSEGELVYLMGMNRKTLKRGRGGAYK